MTLLVLLPAAARTRIVPPDLRLLAALFHRLEQREALFLVLDERVALAVAAQADSFFQVVEAVEVILPLLIDDLQHDVALDALQHLAANELFLLVVRRDDPFPQAIADFIRRQVVEVEAGRIDREDARDLALERLEIPLLEVGGPCRVRVDEGVEDVLGKQRQILAGVENLFAPFIVLELDLSLENLPAQRVHVLALLVHHVVVLEEMFSDREVLRLDLLLSPLDRFGYHPVLDRHAFFHAEALHETRDAIRAEDAHQIVFEREIEARRARIALAAGAAAKLVVDAARLVPLGAEDVQP